MAARKKTTTRPQSKKKVAKKAATKAADEFRDLPPEVRKELRTERQSGYTQHVEDVIDAVEPTSINQIVARLWREYQVVAKRQSVQMKLQVLRKQGVVRRCGLGSYVLASGKK